MKRIIPGVATVALLLSVFVALPTATASAAALPAVITPTATSTTVAGCKASVHAQLVAAHEQAIDTYVALGEPKPATVDSEEAALCDPVATATVSIDSGAPAQALPDSGDAGLPPTQYWVGTIGYCAPINCNIYGAQSTWYYQTDGIWAAQTPGRSGNCDDMWAIFPYSTSNESCQWNITEGGYGLNTNYIEFTQQFQASFGVWWFTLTVTKTTQCTVTPTNQNPNCSYWTSA